ncbi:MAG: RHS repeat-associated core domain-containing protein [Edaphobacter sp.]
MNIPVPNGFINIANGNLHLEIPLSTLKQRGQLSLNERLVYDSRIWKIIQYNNYYWWPLNIPNSAAGWRFVKGNEAGTMAYNSVSVNPTTCPGDGGDPLLIPGGGGDPGGGITVYSYSSSMTWTDPSGTAHLFDAVYNQSDQCDGTSIRSVSGGYATDSSGYQVVDDGNGNPVVKDGNGTEVFPNVIDRFGNYFSPDNGGDLVDDLGRTPVITTQNGNQTYYDVLAPNGPISNNGTRVRYIVTMESLSLNTAFGQQGVVEYQQNGNPPGSNHPNISAIQSIQLPDGSSYQFGYDTYGAINSVTLPTGGVVGYGWTNYQDSYQNVNHWIGSEIFAGNTTNFTPAVISNCSNGGTGCQEKVTVQRPSGDQTVYKLTLDNGAWDTSTTIYAGPASSGQAKATDQATFDFSKVCNYTFVCGGAQYITKSNDVQTLPDANLATQVQTLYANPQSGKATSVAQWDYFQIGSSPSLFPTRKTLYGYTGFDLTSETHIDQVGSPVSSATYNYSGTATATSSVVGHGTANAGGPYLASVVASNNSPTATVATSFTYDDTGALLSTQDANGNPSTTLKYDPTHTFVTEIDKPDTTTNGATYHHVSKAAYDTNSGAILSSDDENSVANGQAYPVKYSYEPVAGRVQKITAADGGFQSYSYPSYNGADITVAQTSSASVTTSHNVDGFGRPNQTSSGSIGSTQAYDVNGRLFSTSSPSTAFSGPAATDGTTYMYYDALDRVSLVQNPDGTTRTVQVVGNVVTATDEIGNQTKQIFNAFGELTSVWEPDPKTGALVLETDYTRNGLGDVTCVEQHGNIAGTGCSASPSSDATSPWRVRRFFYNSLSQLRAASIPEHTALPSAPPQQNCGGGIVGNQWTDCYFYDPNGNQVARTDNRGATRSFTYDALNRPLTETSPTVNHSYQYDAGSNGVGLPYSNANGTLATSFLTYDVMGRALTQSSCALGTCGSTGPNLFTASVTYDLAGNVNSITYPDGRVVANLYDTYNRLSSVNYQKWGTQSVGTAYWSATSYAAPGELQTAQYGNVIQMQAGFNSRQSLTSLSYRATGPAPPQTYFSKTYQWDKNAANLIGETNQTTSQPRQFGYDKLNRLVSAADVASGGANATGTATIIGFEGSYQDCSGGGGLNATVSPKTQAAARIPPGGCVTVWDTGNVTMIVGGYTVSMPYGQGSNSTRLATGLASLLNASGSPVTATVSGTTITLVSIAQGTAANYALSYSSDGDFNVNFSGLAMTGGTTSTPVPGGLNQQYALDNWGNLSSMGSSGFNQSVNLQNQVSSFSYDAAGRLQNDGALTYTYDDDGMLLTSSDGASYTYDASGNRVQVANGGSQRAYVYFGGQLLATYNPTTTAWTDMVYAGGRRVAEVAGTQTATPLYTVLDHIGSEVAAVDSNGTAISALDYTPLGQLLSGSNPDSFIYTGLERDASGLDHATFRQYSSNTGRWTAPDPYDGSYSFGNPQSLNRYAYVGNMPLGSTDPSGLVPGIPIGCGFSTGAEGAGIVFSGGLALANVGADIELLGCIFSAIEDILGFFHHASFHGSLKPRPQARIWNEHLGLPAGGHLPGVGSGGLFNLPGGGCEFGGCGPGYSFQSATVAVPAAVGAGAACVILEPCGAVVAGAATVIAAGAATVAVGYGAAAAVNHYRNRADTTYSNNPVCSAQYERDVAVCRQQPAGKRASCYSQATVRLAACNGGHPKPPLNF